MQGLQNILAGDQCMTVYKAIKQEADAAAELAIALAKGETERPPADRQGPRVRQGRPSVLLTPQAITKDNVKDVVADGYVTKAELCTGAFAAKCTEAGISRPARTVRPGRPASAAAPGTVADQQESRVTARRDREREPRSCSSCGASTRASGRCRSCTTSTFAVYPGEVTALVGDNGAGKSTLVKCIGGIYPIDSGEFLLRGQAGHRPQPARRRGARHRDRLPGPRALRQPRHRPEHVPRPREDARGIVLDEPTMEQMAARDPGQPRRCAPCKSVRQLVASLSGGQRQTVAIAKAVLWNSKVVILDEPTAALGVAQTAQVLELVRRLADNGLAVVLISHNMNDVFAVSDRIAALYLGQMAAQVKTTDVTHAAGRRADHHRPDRAASSPSCPTGVDERSRRHERPHRRRPRRARPSSTRSPSLGEYFRGYCRRVRGGDIGALPAVLGLVVLCIVFSHPAAGVLHRRQLRQPAHPGRRRSPSSPWAWSSSCCSARSTCPPASPAASAPPCWPSLLTDYGWPWYVAIAAALVTGLVIGLRPRLPGGEGRHPVLRGHPGRVPGLPGHGAAAHRQGRQHHPIRDAVDPGHRATRTCRRCWAGSCARSSIGGYAAVAAAARPSGAGAKGLTADPMAVVAVRVGGAGRPHGHRRLRAQPGAQPQRPGRSRSRACRSSCRSSLVLLVVLTLRAGAHRLRPARLRGRRQHRGGPPGRHQRRPASASRPS